MSALNPYENSGTAQAGETYPKKNRSVLLACIAIALPVVIAIVMLFSKRIFVRMFEEFEVKLPFITSIVSSPTIPLGLLGVAILSFFVSTASRYDRIANRWNWISIFISLIALAMYAWGMFSPLIRLIYDLSK